MNTWDTPIPPLLYNTSADPHFLCAIDPGKRICGLSIWRVAMPGNDSEFHASMLWAGKVESPSGNPADMAYLVATEPTYRTRLSYVSTVPTVFVVEVPQKYSIQRKKLHGVDALENVIDELRERLRKCLVAAFKPRIWKGNVPKKVHHRRLRSVLTPDELKAVAANADHNVWDAIGLGLFATGRTRRGGVVYRRN